MILRVDLADYALVLEVLCKYNAWGVLHISQAFPEDLDSDVCASLAELVNLECRLFWAIKLSVFESLGLFRAVYPYAIWTRTLPIAFLFPLLAEHTWEHSLARLLRLRIHWRVCNCRTQVRRLIPMRNRTRHFRINFTIIIFLQYLNSHLMRCRCRL